MLDNTLLFFGSASSSFHLSRNYPLILAGGKNVGFKHGQFLKYSEGPKEPLPEGDKAWRQEMDYEELPLSHLYVTMLNRLGVETEQFADSSGTLDEV